MFRHLAAAFRSRYLLVFLGSWLLSLGLPARSAAATLEILDYYGEPSEYFGAGIRLRIVDPDSQGFGSQQAQLASEVSGDLENANLNEVSPGVFESVAVFPLDEDGMSYNNGRLTAPAGTEVLVRYGTRDGLLTATAPVGPTLRLTDGQYARAASYLLGERVGVEVTASAGGFSPMQRDTLTVNVSAELSADAEAVVLTETGLTSGVFRGQLTVAPAPNATLGNGILEEIDAADGQFGQLTASISVGGATVSRSAPIAARARVELFGLTGRPASSFGAGETARIRVTNLLIPDQQGSIDTAYLEASCGASSDQEVLLLRETGSATHVFEGELPLRIGAAGYRNGRLECAGEEQVSFLHLDFLSPITASASAQLRSGAIEFVDASGQPTGQVLDSRRARVRVTSQVANLDSAGFDVVTAVVASLHTGDSETVSLRETGIRSGIFEGEVWISSRPTGSTQVDVAAAPPPTLSHDLLLASWNGFAAEAEVMTGRLFFTDRQGREVTSTRTDGELELRLESPSLGSPAWPDQVQGEVSAGYYGGSSVYLLETGADTGLYSGPVWLVNFGLQPGSELRASYTTPAGETLRANLPVVELSVRFRDAGGATLAALPAHRPVIVELVRSRQVDLPWEVEHLEVRLRTTAGGDEEVLLLEETAANSATFRGTLPFELGAAVAGSGVLEAAATAAEQVEVALSATPGVLASAPLATAQIRFLDAGGKVTPRLLFEQIATLELDDSTLNLSSTVVETVAVPVAANGTLVGTLPLRETSASSGIFRIQFVPYDPSVRSAAASSVYQLGLTPGASLIARHTMSALPIQAEALAQVGGWSLALIDNAGKAISEVVEGAPLRVRLIDSFQWSSGVVESRTVTVGSRLAGDLEWLVLWETSASSGIFERSLPTRFFPENGNIPYNGELGLAAYPAGLTTGESVVVHYDSGFGDEGIEAEARTVAARLTVLDGGVPVQVAVPTQDGRLKVRIEYPTLLAAGLPLSFTVSSGSDLETLVAFPVGEGAFEGEIRFFDSYWGATSGDGVVAVPYPGSLLILSVNLSYAHSGELRMELPVAGARLRFLDPATGAPLEAAADSRPFKVQLSLGQNDQGQFETRLVAFTTSLAGDNELLQLSETSGASGVFEAIIAPQVATAMAGNGFIEVGRATPASSYDRVSASYQLDYFTTVTATLPLVGPQLLFTSAQGAPSATIAPTGFAYLLVDDGARDLDPGALDQVAVTLQAAELESLMLTETGPHTGIFRGQIPVSRNSFEAGDGILGVSLGAVVFADYHPDSSGGVITAEATVAGTAIRFLDAAGQEVETYREGEPVRLRVATTQFDSSPGQVDQFLVELQSLYWSLDREGVVVTETGPASGIFEGSLATALAPAAAANGILEIGRGSSLETILASAFGVGAQASFVGGSLRLLDLLDREITSIAPNQTLVVELIKAGGNDPQQVDTLVGAVTITTTSAPYIDTETLTVVETGPATGIYRGSIDIVGGFPQPGNSMVEPYDDRDLRLAYTDGVFSLSTRLGLSHNQLPTAQIDFAGLVAGGTTVVDVLANDSDFEGGPLTLGAAISGTMTTATVNADGTLTLHAAASAFGFESVHYLVSDAEGGITRGEVVVFFSSPPTVTLLSPAAGTIFNQQDQVVLAATAASADGYDISDTIYWSSDREGGLATGANLVFPAAILRPGPHLMTATAYSNDGNTASASVAIVIDAAPELTLVNPGEGEHFLQQGPYTLRATATDLEEGDLAAAISWVSDLQGPLGTGGELTVNLVPGLHLLTATVIDQAGNRVSASRSVNLNTPPSITITAPTEGAVIDQSTAIEASAIASDLEDPAPVIYWAVDGTEIGQQGTQIYLGTMATGRHTLTARVVDSGEGQATATVMIRVVTRPTVTIVEPASTVTINQGEAITLVATASDGEGGDLAAAIEWSSNLSGQIGQGASITTSALAVGLHELTAQVVDPISGYIGSDTVQVVVNAAPTVVIASPLPGATYRVGTTVSFTAEATDPEDGSLTGIAWSSDRDGALGVGATLGLSNLSAGPHQITATVADGRGFAASATVAIRISAPPLLTITSPASGAVITGFEVLHLTGTAADPDEENVDRDIRWTSDRDGLLGIGAAVDVPRPSFGQHLITATVFDHEGNVATATVTIVINGPPQVAIQSPASGAVFAGGRTITFTGIAFDDEDGDLASQIHWSSSRDGALGVGATLATTTLSAGVHLISATVTDTVGITGTDTITVTVNANTAPAVIITSPAPGVWVGLGESVSFSGSASDVESGDVSASLVWTSNLAGTLGSGPSFATSALGVGNHIVTATATDPQGSSGAAAVMVFVKVVAKATFISAGPLDGFVLESAETSGVGGQVSTGQLRLGDNIADRQYRSFFSFDTSALPDNAVIRKVTLRAVRSGTTGTNPATTHGALQVDVKSGYFGSSTALEAADFQDAPTVAATCLFTPATLNGFWSEGTFDAAGRNAVSLTSTTQLRLQFSLDDDDDGLNDYLDHYGGEATSSTARPQLVVEYLQ